MPRIDRPTITTRTTVKSLSRAAIDGLASMALRAKLPPGLILGYARPTERQIEQGVALLGEAMAG